MAAVGLADLSWLTLKRRGFGLLFFGFVATFVGRQMEFAEGTTEAIGLFLNLSGFAAICFGCAFVAASKGWTRLFGVLGVISLVVAPIVVLLLPNRTKKDPPPAMARALLEPELHRVAYEHLLTPAAFDRSGRPTRVTIAAGIVTFLVGANIFTRLDSAAAQAGGFLLLVVGFGVLLYGVEWFVHGLRVRAILKQQPWVKRRALVSAKAVVLVADDRYERAVLAIPRRRDRKGAPRFHGQRVWFAGDDTGGVIALPGPDTLRFVRSPRDSVKRKLLDHTAAELESTNRGAPAS